MILSDLSILENKTFPVIIIGSGPAGISTALELDKFNIETLIIEAGSRKYNDEQDPVLKQKYLKKVYSKLRLHTGEQILAGYSKQERNAYKSLLQKCNMVDCFRVKHPKVIDQFSWFNIRIKGSYSNNLGWLIDRFIVPSSYQSDIVQCEIAHFIGVRNKDKKMISDHIPIFLEINN